MIHYHGTPISGGAVDSSAFFGRSARHALVSHYRPEDLPAVMAYASTYVLDNGAYSHWRAGKGDIDFNEYHKWVQDQAGHPGLDWALIPDKIDGTQEDNADLVTRWLRTGSRVEGVPVYHLHEDLSWLDHLVSSFRTVAIGSSGQWATPGTPDWWGRIAEVMKVACDSNGRPRTRLHGLRQLDYRIFQLIPYASCDSCNAGVNAGSISRWGSYPPPNASQRADDIAARIESHNSAPVWAGYEQMGLAI